MGMCTLDRWSHEQILEKNWQSSHANLLVL